MEDFEKTMQLYTIINYSIAGINIILLALIANYSRNCMTILDKIYWKK